MNNKGRAPHNLGREGPCLVLGRYLCLGITCAWQLLGGRVHSTRRTARVKGRVPHNLKPSATQNASGDLVGIAQGPLSAGVGGTLLWPGLGSNGSAPLGCGQLKA